MTTPAFRRLRRRTLLAVAAVAVAAAVSVPFALSSGTKNAHVVHQARNAMLGTTILVDRRGRTLYDLSAERHGRFVCTAACLSLWHPLHVRRGVKPTGAPHLATITRPDTSIQVTYRGRPLYTFVDDHKRGDVKGNGFKDVGVWRAATISAAAAPPGASRTTYPY